MDTSEYLKRIGIYNFTLPDFDSLVRIHRSHLMNIPFENLSIHNNEIIELDTEKLYEKIILRKRGGFCYELNGLFYSLLCSLGYSAKMVSARVYNGEGIAGPDFDHMSLIVKLNNTEWLCDVGFGDSFIEPLELITNKEQKQRNFIYRISEAEDNELLLSRTSDRNNWEPQYLFTAAERKLDDYNLMCTFHQSSEESPFTRKRVCTIATENGRITLRDNRLIITEDALKKEISFNGEDQFNNYLNDFFKIKIQGSLFPS